MDNDLLEWLIIISVILSFFYIIHLDIFNKDYIYQQLIHNKYNTSDKIIEQTMKQLIEQTTRTSIEQTTGPSIEQTTGPSIEQTTGPLIEHKLKYDIISEPKSGEINPIIIIMLEIIIKMTILLVLIGFGFFIKILNKI